MVKTLTSNFNFLGARGSNTGDQFHELWALQQILDLLVPETRLKAVSVEGVKTETASQGANEPTWDGVDCALYYGGTSLETADLIEFAQLKYSAANPETAWSVARLTANTKKRGNNSVIRKMADDFKGVTERMKQGAQLKIWLVSNQNISEGIKKAHDARWTGSLEKAGLDESTEADLKLLQAASGLSAVKFQRFLGSLDFSECGSHSRFAKREKVVATVARLLGDDVSSEVRELQTRVHELMMPERSREIITDKDLLLWFGLSSREGLFPCPPDIRVPNHVVARSAADEVVKLLTEGERLVLVHGSGGCGKTTLMRQVANLLPDGSVTIFFDCFGGGRYKYSDDKRHLPENAFLQLANELAIALRLPLFIPRNTKSPASIQSFLARLRSAAKAYKKLAPVGMLVIIADAADNAVAAANNSNPPEHPFVFDLFGANLSDLPENVRIITSCRTDASRRASLQLPEHISEVLCPPFTLPETRQLLEGTFPNPSDSLVEQFHSLSNANPRVQTYAINTAKGDRECLLEALLPGGKGLADVLKESFDSALKKLGEPQIFVQLIGVLAFLPAPIDVTTIARIVECTEDTVRDLALDLAPGLRLSNNAVTIADEDFDAFIKDKGSVNRDKIIAAIAEDFITNFQTDPYSSIHVAGALIDAGRARDILFVIESDPQVEAIGDPIVCRQVQIGRLKLSLVACREVGSTVDALKTVLISAEAERDDSTLNEVLESELDLSVEFCGASLRRSILMDPDRIKERGSFLAQDAVRAIRAGDRAMAREQLHFHEAWLKHRPKAERRGSKRWTISDRDISARVEAIWELAGPKVAFDELMRWSPRDVPLRVAFILIPQLIAAGKTDNIKALMNECSLSGPWDLLLWVPLAMAGESVDGAAIQKSLKRLRKCFFPAVDAFRASHNEEAWEKTLFDTFITACELAFKLNQDRPTILVAVNRILDVLGDKQKGRLYGFDVHRIDGLLRCWLLREIITEKPAKVEQFIEFVTGLVPVPQPEDRPSGKRREKRSDTDQKDKQGEQLNKKIRALFPIYMARIDVLLCAVKNERVKEQQLDLLGKLGSHSYDFDHDHDSTYLREKAACSVMRLLIIESIQASELFKRAHKLVVGRYSDLFSRRCQRLWSWMRLRTSEANTLLLHIAKNAKDIKELREASSEKLEAIIRLSRLVLPVSRDDAESLFNDAVSIAKEIDQEAFDQIDFVSVLADHALISDQCYIKTIAFDLHSFISGAAERLSGHDRFPWSSAIHALTCVDDATALAAISRWADDATVDLDETLDKFLLTALQRGLISLEAATSLAILIGGSYGEFRKELVSRSAVDPQKHKGVIEELGKETLLLFPQHSRLALGQEIAGQIPQYGQVGPWSEHLEDMIKFLGYGDRDKPEKEVTDSEDREIQSTNENDLLKEFAFDSQGEAFTTSEAIVKVLEAAKSSDLHYRSLSLLRTMRNASSSPRNRIPFLNALAKIPEDLIWSTDRCEMLNETLAFWKGTPAVDRWCKESLPSVLVEHFYSATRWLKEGQSFLHELLDHTCVDVDGRLKIILEGVARNGEALNSRSLFAIAEEIARVLDPVSAGKILYWYAQRLRNRLPVADQLACVPTEIPGDKTEAIGRFLFALMSDIDTRVRWKAAHALRRLAKLGCFDIVKSTFAQLNREKDDAFRDPTGPYYYLAAKLWFAISLYRISAEMPEALGPYKADIFHLATSDELPHVAVREYAKRTLRQLESAGAISLTASENDQIHKVNAALKGKTAKKGDYRSFGRAKEDKWRFKYDTMDTLQYWYKDILQMFPSVSQELVIEIADRWIIDKWGAEPEANWWDKEPRKNRYDERRYGLWSNSHGSFPTVERYGRHLEWNAMYCVVGELLKAHPLRNEDESYYDCFDYWLGNILPTAPPAWISDNRGPTPLEPRLWEDDSRTDNGWLHNIRRDEFLTEIGVHKPQREGWVVVEGYFNVYFSKREMNVRINSALVEPETAPALVRALQTASNPWDFRIPDEDDSLQIDVTPYRLSGWIANVDGDTRFDENDPYRYETSQVRARPGRKLMEELSLVPHTDRQGTWICSKTGEAAFIYEAWCDEPPRERDNYIENIRSNGWRLWAKADVVQSFIINGGWNLICEIQVDRRLRNDIGRSYESDKKKKTHEKILLLKSDGSVADTKGCIGSWSGVSRGAGTRSRR